MPSSHDPNPYAIRNQNTARRVGKASKPSPTVISGGLVPGSDAPFIAKEMGGTTSGYPERLMVELPQEAPPRVGMRLASFFCGAGGFDLGFRSAGFELAFASDYAERAAATFVKNLGHQPVVGDIRNVGPKNYPSEPVDVVTGGFPCVTFSMAGHRAGVTDDLNGKLYLELCRVITELNPRYFVAENVAGMLSANGGSAIKLVLASFLRLGYRTDFQLVNMAEHGVPQTRQRVIFLGVRLDQWRGSFRFPEKTHRLARDKDAPKWLPRAVSLRDAIGDLPEPGEVISMQTHEGGATYAALGRPPTVGYGYSKPRKGDDPAHSQPTSPNIIHFTRDGSKILGHTGGENAYVTKAALTPGKKKYPRDVGRFRSPDEPSMTPTSMHPPHVVINTVRNGDGIAWKNARRSAAEPSTVVCSYGPPELTLKISNHEANNAATSDGYAMSKRVAKSSEPAPTAVAHNGGNVHPFIDGMRRMTARECARVQSFPDWYEFDGNSADAYRQIGNAVPPLYAKSLAQAILEYDARKVIK